MNRTYHEHQIEGEIRFIWNMGHYTARLEQKVKDLEAKLKAEPPTRTAADHTAALRVRLEEAERDAARYTFMRDNMVSVEYHVPFGEGSLACRVKTFHQREANGSLLDEAIDILATPTTTEGA